MKVFFWFLCFLPIVYVAGTYDYFQLVQQWPPTFCSVSRATNCSSPLKFTIHGLWPSNSSDTKAPNCTGSPFDSTKISSLKSNLINDWPDLKGNHESFWKHEWTKHGTCSETKYDQLQYFNTTLTLKNQFDILDTLVKANITASTAAMYESIKITEAIQNKTGFTPRLWCRNGKLLEISLCVNTSLAYMHCPSVLLNYQLNLCPVHFPDKVA